jgi:hypothetical protein
MSMTLQTSSLITQTSTPNDPGQQLQSEYGWTEVGKGLTRILIGYFIALVGTIMGIGVLMFAALGHETQQVAKGNQNTMLLIVMLGGGLLVLSSLFSYGFILAGKWRCLMNAPERHAAKWLMFACLLCMVIGPVLNILFSLAGEGANNYKQLRNVPEGAAVLKFDSVGSILQLLGTVLTVISSALFVLFLRAVGCCFNNRFLVTVIHLYLVYAALLIGITGQLVYTSPRTLTKPEVLLGWGAAWVIGGLGYVFVVFLTRICIAHGAGRIRSPLAA